MASFLYANVRRHFQSSCTYCKYYSKVLGILNSRYVSAQQTGLSNITHLRVNSLFKIILTRDQTRDLRQCSADIESGWSSVHSRGIITACTNHSVAVYRPALRSGQSLARLQPPPSRVPAVPRQSVWSSDRIPFPCDCVLHPSHSRTLPKWRLYFCPYVLLCLRALRM